MERAEELKAITLQKVQELKVAMDALSREISPKHWRSSGFHFQAIREMEEKIPLYTPMTDDERKNPLVQEGLVLPGDYFKKKTNGTTFKVLVVSNGEVTYQEVSSDKSQIIGAMKIEPIGEFLFKFEVATL